jgi:hypothetical protein
MPAGKQIRATHDTILVTGFVPLRGRHGKVNGKHVKSWRLALSFFRKMMTSWILRRVSRLYLVDRVSRLYQMPCSLRFRANFLHVRCA